jgi:ABC-2 type transport system ATP-binding protein
LPLPAEAAVSNGFVTVRTSEPLPLLNEITGWAMSRGIDLSSLEVGRPSLEEIYLELTAEAGQE